MSEHKTKKKLAQSRPIILWASDSPLVSTAYGIQTALFTPRLVREGHPLVMCGLDMPPITPTNFDGVKLIGGGRAIWGNDVLPQHMEHFNTKALITMKDVYAFDEAMLSALPGMWFPVVPLDTEPIMEVIKSVLRFAVCPIAITRNGQELMKQEGIDSFYAPHGIDLSVFRKGNKQKAKESFHLNPDHPVVLFVGNNNVSPSRHGIEELIATWAMYCQRHDTGTLVLHTQMRGSSMDGIDIPLMLQGYGVPPERVKSTEQYRWYIGGMDAQSMARLYNAADVLLYPCWGQGFGMPLLEAQACGTPVITVAWTAGREMVWAGTAIEATPDNGSLIWTSQGFASGFRFRPLPGALLQALEETLAQSSDPELSNAAIAGAREYEVGHVIKKYWKPALQEIYDIIEGKI